MSITRDRVRRTLLALAVFVLGLGGITPVVASPAEASTVTSRIVGGTKTPITAVPWQVWLFRDANDGNGGGYVCGGSFISTRLVLTAAHCVTDVAGDVVESTDVYVYSGMSNLGKMTESNLSRPLRIIRHQDYAESEFSIANDIAVIELDSDVTFGRTRSAIALPFDVDAQQWPANGARLTISGWGTTRTGGSIPAKLQSATIYAKGGPLDSTSCGEWSDAEEYDPTQFLCAGSPKNGKDICQGDSGGPYAAQVNGLWTLAGITSFNSGVCGLARLPGIATRVTSFTDWLIPPPPTNVTWEYSHRTAWLTWDDPVDSSVGGNFYYYVEESSDRGVTWYPATFDSVSLGQPGQTEICPTAGGCIYRMAAINTVNQGNGPFRFQTIPTAPQSVKVVRKSKRSITVSWKPPARVYESPLEDYQVYWSRSANGDFTALPAGITTATRLTFARPSRGRIYIQVRARNGVDIPGDDYGTPSVSVPVR